MMSLQEMGLIVTMTVISGSKKGRGESKLIRLNTILRQFSKFRTVSPRDFSCYANLSFKWQITEGGRR